MADKELTNLSYNVHGLSMNAFDLVRVLEVLDRNPLDEYLKQILIDIKSSNANFGIDERKKVLTHLCKIIAYPKRELLEYEKDFFYRYIQDAVLSGLDVSKIGLNDEVFCNLLLGEESELDLEQLRNRNENIVEFAKNFDVIHGFYEKTAAKFIRNYPEKITSMVERCFDLMNKTEPKGILFALELINLRQYKSAVKVLAELAKRGKATEMISFLHRLLPNVKGAESMILSMLKLNLKAIKQKDFFENDLVFREYPARLYVLGIYEFIECGLYKEAFILLSDVVNKGWVKGFDDLEKKCFNIAKLLKEKDEELSSVDDIINLFGDKYDVSEEFITDAKDLIDDEKKHGFSVKNIFNINKKEDTIKDENIGEFVEAFYDANIVENKVEEVKVFDEEVLSSELYLNDKDGKAEEAVESVEGIESVENVVVEEVVINNIEEVKEDVKDLAMASNSKAGGNPKSEIEEWETAFDEATRPNTKRRINFENILKISSSDVDKHFEKIKEVTTLAIKRAEEKALVIKQKIEDRMDDEDIENPSVVTKFKSIANKLKNFKKK